MRQAVTDAGRDPQSFQIIANGAKVEHIEALTAAGVDEAVFALPPLGPEVVIPKLDKLASEAGLA